MRAMIDQLARFGAVGLLGFVVDVGIFNLLRATLLDSESVHEGPLLAKFISTCFAIAVNYVGNRYWTFGATKRAQVVREGAEFVLVSLGGMAITLACLWISHYLLGFTSQLADNISGNVIGLGLGTLFRFAFYRYWVFHPSREMPIRAPQGSVRPTGPAPLAGVQAIAAIDDRAAVDH